MLRFRAFLLMTLLAAFAVRARAEEPSAVGAAPAGSATSAAQPAAIGPVWYIRLQGNIDFWLARYLAQRLSQAQTEGASIIVVEIETNGGFVDAAEEMAQSLLDVRNARTVAYVVNKAFSAGAYVAIACDEIYMQEGAVIGSALPFTPAFNTDEKKLEYLVEEKFITALTGKFRSLAEKKAHSPALAEAMVDPRLQIVEVTVEGKRVFMRQEDFDTALKTEKSKPRRERRKIELVKIVCRAGTILDLTTKDASTYGFASPVKDRADLVGRLTENGARLFVETEPSSWEKVARFLSSPMLSGILIVLAVIALMIEIKTPSLGIGGATFLFFIGLFFWSKFMAGQSGPIEIILFLVGVIPGFGIAGVAGVAFMGLSILLSFVPESAWPPDFAVRPWVKDTIMQSVSTGIVTIAAAGVAGFAAFLALKRLLPHAPVVRGVFLPANAVGGRAAAPVPPPMLEARAAAVAPVGAVGTTESDLHPSGKAMFDDMLVDVVTEGDFIARGAKVRVIEVSGNRIVVTRA